MSEDVGKARTLHAARGPTRLIPESSSLPGRVPNGKCGSPVTTGSVCWQCEAWTACAAAQSTARRVGSCQFHSWLQKSPGSVCGTASGGTFYFLVKLYVTLMKLVLSMHIRI